MDGGPAAVFRQAEPDRGDARASLVGTAADTANLSALAQIGIDMMLVVHGIVLIMIVE